MATYSYPYQSRPRQGHPAKLIAPCGDAASQPHRPFSAVPLMLLAVDGLLGGWAYWQLQAGVLWAWPIVIVTRFAPYWGLWLVAGTSVAGLGVALLSLASPRRDVISKALAILGLAAHVVVLALVAYSVTRVC